MKIKILLITVLLCSITTFGQNETSEHMTFKGVPIDGTLNEYVSKMKQNGFTHLATEEGTSALNGDFAGYKDCIIGVSTLKEKDLVHKIVVLFPEKQTWSTLYGNYSNLKEMLIEKYGEPSEEIEKFENKYSQPKDDNAKMYELNMDRCKYYSIFNTDKGSIELSIEKKEFNNGFVKLLYLDKINTNVIRAKAKGDL